MSAGQGWDDILDEGETILWQGRPDTRVVIRPGNVFMTIFGLIFAGFALFWMVMASQAPGGLWMFGMIHFSIGVGIIAAALFWGPYKRRHTWYTLTTKRAFIATDLPVVGRQLKSYPITPGTILDLTRGDRDTIIFHEEQRRGRNGSYTVKIGFERIENGAEVYRMMRDVQDRAG